MDRDRLRACSSQDLTRSARDLHATLSAAHAALLEIIAVIDERELWRADGCASLEDWISLSFQVTRKTAHEWAGAARALDGLPRLADAFASGELSWDKTKAATMLATPDCDEAVTQEALTTDVGHLDRAARKARSISLAQANARHWTRHLSLRRSITAGGVKMTGFLPDVDGETLLKPIERLAGDAVVDPDTGLYQSFDQRCADALVELAAGYLASEQPVHGERATVVAHVDLSPSGTDAHGECDSGIPVAQETIERLICDAVIEPIFERDGHVIGIGRKRREPPQWLRRCLAHRDEGCRFPGCIRNRGLHAHHIEHWPDGGPTDTNNLVMLCRHHHRLVHEGGRSLRGDPDGQLGFIRPDGDVITTRSMGIEETTRRRLIDPVLPPDPGDP